MMQRERREEAAADSAQVESAISDESADRSIENEDEGEEFEFTFASDDSDVAVADDIFLNGQIRPAFPLFDKGLFQLYLNDPEEEEEKVVKMPLKKLLLEDEREEESPSTSSSEDKELDGIPEESYCLWTPGSTPPPSRGLSKKSKSTGSSSLRLKLCDLVVGRSHSDGKHKFFFLAHTSSPPESKPEAEKKKNKKNKKKDLSVAKVHSMFYVKGAGAAADRRRLSYLPYRRDLVGLFAPMGGSSGAGGFQR